MLEEKIRFETLELDLQSFQEIKTDRPQIIFKDRGVEYGKILEALHEYGPFDANTNSRILRRSFNGIELLFFYPETPEKERIIDALDKLAQILREGYTACKHYDITFDGMAREFRLTSFYAPERKDFIGYKPGSLSQSVERNMNLIREIQQRGNIPIVIVGGSAHRSSRARQMEYIEVKKEFTKRDISSQYVSYYEEGRRGLLYSLLEEKSPGLGFEIWNLGLNIYGKAGGIAWIVEQSLSFNVNFADLSIGLRFARDPRRGGYVVGHATILDRFGRLVGCVTSRPLRVTGMTISRENMREYLKNILKKALSDQRVKDVYSISKKKVLNIALHRLNHFHPKEKQGILQAINDIESLYDFKDLKIALISIVKDPSLMLFDVNQRSRDIRWGTAFKLNENTLLLYTTGSIHRYSKRLSYPIIVMNETDEKHSFITKHQELAAHILSLSVLHWQTVIPCSVRLPATIEFAGGVARLFKFGVYPRQNSQLEKTLWFI